jgi:transposase
VLEGANIQLASVITGVLGVSGRAMLEALAQGLAATQQLARLARPRLVATPEMLERALEGRMGAHQRGLGRRPLDHVAFLDQQVAGLDTEIAQRLAPCAAALAHLDTIPGVSVRVAQEVVAVLGTAMRRFPSARPLASWARLCPGTDERAGKRRGSGTGQGNASLRTALPEAAWAASHAKQTYLAAQFRRLAARRGRQRAIVAVAHTILGIVYYLLRDDTDYRELGGGYFDERSKQTVTKRAVQRLEHLGFKVTLEPVA